MLFGKKKDYPLAPAGNHNAVCVDQIMHMGVEVVYAGETKIVNQLEIRWAIDEHDEHDEPVIVSNGRPPYCPTASIGPRAKLRPFLEAWRGRPFTPAEEEGFDEEKMVGVPCLLSIVHAESTKGNKYHRVSAATPVPKGMTPMKVPDWYVREKDRPRELDHDHEPIHDTDDRVPF